MNFFHNKKLMIAFRKSRNTANKMFNYKLFENNQKYEYINRSAIRYYFTLLILHTTSSLK